MSECAGVRVGEWVIEGVAPEERMSECVSKKMLVHL